MVKKQMFGTWADCDGPTLYVKRESLIQVGEVIF